MPDSSYNSQSRKRGRFTIVLFSLILAVACVAFLVTGHVRRMASNLSNVSLQRVYYAGAANARLADGFIQTVLAVHSSNEAERRQHLAAIPPITAFMTESLEKFEAIPLNDLEKERLNKFKAARAEYSLVRAQCFELLAKDSQQASVFLIQKLLPLYNRYDQAGEELWSSNTVQAKGESEQIIETASRAQLGLTVGAILAVIFGFSAGLYRIFATLEW